METIANAKLRPRHQNPRPTAHAYVHTSPTKRSSDFIAHLEQLDRRYGPRPGQPFTPVVLVEDNGPIHTSELAPDALDQAIHQAVDALNDERMAPPLAKPRIFA
jgi:hypothetical protein